MNTRGKILDKALEMFNERGIEYVGLRELAAALNIRVGNITYYFPTKDDLVYELSLELRKCNSEIIVAHGNLTMKAFLEMLHQVFQNHIRFKCLLLSFVHLMEQNKRMAATYKETQDQRNAVIASNLEVLAASGYLKVQDEADMLFLVSALSLINRFWISEAAVSFRQWSPEAQVQHYLSLIGKLLQPYATPKAQKEMQEFFETL